MRLILFNNNLMPHLFVLSPQVTQLRRRFVDHSFPQFNDHGIQSRPDDYPVQRTFANRIGACVHFLCRCLLLQKRLTNRIIRIHQRTKVVANPQEHIVRISLGNLLYPLYFLVVLYFLRVTWIWYLSELRLQIIQYILNLASGALDVFVKLASLLDCCNRRIRSSQ